MEAKNMNQSVSQAEIEKLLAMREAKAHLKKRLELMAESISELEESLLDKIEGGAAPQGYELSIRQSEKRFPKWKEEFINVAGKAEADAVLEATDPKIYKSLIIKAA